MSNRRRWPFWATLALFLGLLAVDQAVKEWARATLVVGQSLGVPWPGVFEITLTFNRGAAFGLFQGYGHYLTPIAVLITVWALWFSWRHREEPPMLHVAMALLAAGAVGNKIDRLFHQEVTDMFWFRLIDFPVFNVADACITVACALLAVFWLVGARGRSPEPAPAGTRPADGTEPR